MRDQKFRHGIFVIIAVRARKSVSVSLMIFIEFRHNFK